MAAATVSVTILPAALLACLACCYMSSVCARRPLSSASTRHTAGLSSSASGSQPMLFAFGASILDVGQNSAAMPRRSRADYSPYGCDHFGKPAGRWSNGRTFMDFITEGLGYDDIPPYLQAVGADYSNGVNFASSGSTAANSSQTGSDSGGLFCLLVQIDQFVDFQGSVLSERNKKRGSLVREQFSDAIYIIETGTNDYYKAGIDSLSDQLINETISITIAAMKTAFQKLYDLGARAFLVMNLPPFGCYPSKLAKVGGIEELDENNCSAKWNSIAHEHNARLDELLTELQEDYATAEWVLFDAHSIFMEAYANPSKFGIEYPFQACCGAGGTYNYNVEVICGAESQYINGTLVEWTRCENPSLHISWDGRHPVESFAYYMAQGVLLSTHVIPSSFNIVSRVQRSQGLKS